MIIEMVSRKQHGNPSRKDEKHGISFETKTPAYTPNTYLTLGANLIEQVREHRVLGVTLDEELKWQSHIDSVCKKFARNFFLLGQLKHYVSIDSQNVL